MVTANPWLLLTVVLMTFVYRTAAVAEEAQFITTDMGADYRDYQRLTGMFLPRFPTPGMSTPAATATSVLQMGVAAETSNR